MAPWTLIRLVLESQLTLHVLLPRATYGMFIVRMWGKNERSNFNSMAFKVCALQNIDHGGIYHVPITTKQSLLIGQYSLSSVLLVQLKTNVLTSLLDSIPHGQNAKLAGIPSFCRTIQMRCFPNNRITISSFSFHLDYNFIVTSKWRRQQCYVHNTEVS